MTTYATSNGAQLVRGERHEIIGSDGTRFSGVSMGLSVGKGVCFVEFEGVDGDAPTTTKRRFFNFPLTALTTPRPRMFWDK